MLKRFCYDEPIKKRTPRRPEISIHRNGETKMKKMIAFLLAAILVLGCTACGSKKDEGNDRLAQIKENGYIELCTEPYFAPFEYVDPTKTGDDQYQGMDLEVAKYIADKIGVDLKITALDFTAVLAGVADGKYDFAISAIAYSPERA